MSIVSGKKRGALIKGEALIRDYTAINHASLSKTRPDTRHKMLLVLVCVLFTFESNMGPTDGPTDLRTYGPTDGRTDRYDLL